MSNLVNLKVKSMQLYYKYKEGSISLENYLKQIKPISEVSSLIQLR